MTMAMETDAGGTSILSMPGRFDSARKQALKGMLALTTGIFDEEYLEARAAPGGPSGEIATRTFGGVVEALGDHYGGKSHYGIQGLTDGGLADAEMPITDNTRQRAERRVHIPPTHLIVHSVITDQNMYAGPQGLLPWKRNEGNVITTTTWRFGSRVLDVVPEFGSAPYMGYTKDSTQHYFTRYGAGIFASTDFYKSAAGQEIYFQQIVQIMNCIHETAAWDVMYALLTADTLDNQKRAKLRSYRSRAYEERILRDEVATWHKLGARNGFEELYATLADDIATENGAVVDTVVVAKQAAVHMMFGSEQRFQAYKAGEAKAVAARTDAMSAVRSLVAGPDVFITRTFKVDKGPNRARNPLQFAAQIGEYYLMRDMNVGTAADAPYRSLACAIEIYNETLDQWARLTLQSAIDGCNLWGDDDHGAARTDLLVLEAERLHSLDAETMARELKDKPYEHDGHGTLRWKTIGGLYRDMMATPTGAAVLAKWYSRTTNARPGADNPTVMAALYGAAGDVVSGETRLSNWALKALAGANVPLPVAFIVGRPHAEYGTLSTILLKRGLATGATYYRDGIFSVSEDAGNQSVRGQFTFEQAATVEQPGNVYVVRNSFVNLYRGGMNAKPIEAANYDPSTGIYGATHDDPPEDEETPDIERPSLFYFLATYEEVNEPGLLHNPLSLHGELSLHLRDGTPSPTFGRGPGTAAFSTLPVYEALFRFRETIVPSPDPLSRDFVQDVRPTNAVMFMGHTRHWNERAGAFGALESTTMGTGHWGASGTYIGCNRMREGRVAKDFSGA